MKIVVCGSTNPEYKQVMIDLESILRNIFGKDAEIIFPIDGNLGDKAYEFVGLFNIKKRYVELIRQANLVVIVPKFAGNSRNHTILEIGESTSYEMAIATDFDKPIMFWDPRYSFGYIDVEKNLEEFKDEME